MDYITQSAKIAITFIDYFIGYKRHLRYPMKRHVVSVVLAAATLLSGCGLHGDTMAIGGVGGAAAGAGTGAIIGAAIANGDIAASALLGTAIGLPAGLAIAAIYDYSSQRSVSERRLAEIEANQRDIFNRQREIDALREQIRNDGPTGNPAEELRDYNYSGPSLGTY